MIHTFNLHKFHRGGNKETIRKITIRWQFYLCNEWVNLDECWRTVRKSKWGLSLWCLLRQVSSHLSLGKQASCRANYDSSVERYVVLYNSVLNKHQLPLVFNRRNGHFFQHWQKTWMCWMYRVHWWCLSEGQSRMISMFHFILGTDPRSEFLGKMQPYCNVNRNDMVF